MSSTLHEHHALRARALLLGLVLACTSLGCRGEDAPTWIPLARGFVPPSGAALERAWGRSPAPIGVRAEDGGRTLLLELPLPAKAWRASAAPGATFHEWRTPCPLLRALRDDSEKGLGLELGGTPVPGVFERTRAEQRVRAGEDVFSIAGQGLVLLRASARPPGPGRFSCRIERGQEEQGVWRAAVQEVVADGLSLWPGESWETDVELPPGSALRFVTLARSLGRAGRVLFRVTRDGETLLEHEQELAELGPGTGHVLPLSSAGAAHFSFEVQGDPGLTAFLHPVIGPLAVGTPGRRPWQETRPSIVLFLADTFRADLLADSGGPAEVAPNLNRIAARSLRFSHARSPSTWTLPAQSSLFTGLFPTQHGAVHEGLTFSPAIVTLAEHMARAGYRTGAVTDSGFVSRQYGLDQGFEWFLEHTEALGHRLAKTLHAAREFLAHDDGRPVFLFVHTYRTHWPYRTGDQEDRSAHDALVARFSAGLAPGQRPDPASLATFAAESLALYRQGASALDRLVGPWFDELEQAGFFRPGYFVFTSDHGEAFFEHGKSEHRGPPFEEELRVPLLLFGPGLGAESARASASLIDLAPTLAELCGLAPDPLWCGRSLLAPAADRLTFAWHGGADASASSLAIVAGERKLFAPARTEALERGDVKAAFELGLDPAEHENVVKHGAVWPAELARSAAAQWQALERLHAPSSEVEISSWLEEELAKLGYGGQ